MLPLGQHGRLTLERSGVLCGPLHDYVSLAVGLRAQELATYVWTRAQPPLSRFLELLWLTQDLLLSHWGPLDQHSMSTRFLSCATSLPGVEARRVSKRFVHILDAEKRCKYPATILMR